MSNRETTAQASFNKNTKLAVLASKPDKKCCKKARLLGLLLFGQVFSDTEIRIASENEATVDHVTALLEKLVKISVSEYKETFSELYKLCIQDPEKCRAVLEFFGYGKEMSSYYIPQDIFRCDACRQEFLKGVFLVCGNVSDPEKSYHLEMNVSYFNLSRDLLYFLKKMGMEAKYTKRTSHYVIYYKESEKIVDFLGIIDAKKENFEYYNTLIQKDLRNQINRLNNCETANMSKQISAASKQIEAINRIFSLGQTRLLPDELVETATLRLENPSASLSELAALHNPPVTKSCVNRRLKKLTEFE